MCIRVCVCAPVPPVKMAVTWAMARKSVTTQSAAAGGPTPPWFTGFLRKEPHFLPPSASLFIFLLVVRALILDQPGPLLLNRKCFMLVKIIAFSFPSHKIPSVIRRGVDLQRQSLSWQSDGRGFN